MIVKGSYLRFTIKVIDGRAIVADTEAKLFSDINVETSQKFSDNELQIAAQKRLGVPANSTRGLSLWGREIVFIEGAWHTVNMYSTSVEGQPLNVAVDVATGKAFLWDGRTGLKENSRQRSTKGAGVSGAIGGETVDRGPILPDSKITELPLSFLSVQLGGKTYVTDKNGGFSAPGLEIAPEGLELTATLSGPYVRVEDYSGKTLKIKVTVKPGEGNLKVVFNPKSRLKDENALSQVNSFQKVNLALSFLRDRLLTTKRMDTEAIVVHTNLNEECNAYYAPGERTLNFFASSDNCVNSGYDTVADHEEGHDWHQMAVGIPEGEKGGGLSEGWGDTLSMYLLNNPIIGEHFLKHPGRDGIDYIRHGENTYQYDGNDEVHAQGQAWGGFTWKLRKALMASPLGEAAGAALAETLVLPTMFAGAVDIPAAIYQVLLHDMDKDGKAAHEDLIRATAKIHGIELPALPGKGIVNALVSATMKAASGRAIAAVETLSKQEGQTSSATLRLSAAPMRSVEARRQIEAALAYLPAHVRGAAAQPLREIMTPSGVDFILSIEGPRHSVDYVIEQFRRLGGVPAAAPQLPGAA